MNENSFLNQIKQIGIGLAFIIFPILFVFAFAVHPGLLKPRLLGPEELILRAHGNELLQFGHVLVMLSTGLLIVVALHFMKLLDRSSAAWAGFIGAVLAILGAIMLAADKGALCLTMSAFDTLPENVVRPNHAGCNGYVYKTRLAGVVVGHGIPANRLCHSSHCLAQDPYFSSLAEYACS